MTAEAVGPVDDRGDRPDDGPAEDVPVGTVGQELALLLQLVAERSGVVHPVVTLVREHPEHVEQLTDTVVGWVRAAQDTIAEATGGSGR